MSSKANLLDSLQLESKTAVLIDGKTGKVLYDINASEPMHPSSMTKVMTALLVLEAIKLGNLKLEDKVKVSVKAWRMEGSRMFLEPRLTPTVDEILHGILVVSGNDASVAIAEHLAGSEEAFALMMNAKAKEIGLTSTNFLNASGLPHEQHKSTALDLARLAMHTIKAHPEILMYTRKNQYKYNNIQQMNLNSLLENVLGVDGLKTGSSSKGGFGIVATGERDNTRLIAVVNGLKTQPARIKEAKYLLNWGFNNFKTMKVYSANQPIVEVPVWMGSKNKISLVLHEDMLVTLAKKNDRTQFLIKVPSVVKGRVKTDAPIGTIDVIDEEGGAPSATFPLYPAENVRPTPKWMNFFKMIDFYWNNKK